METHVSGIKEYFIKKNENGSPGDVSVNLIPNWIARSQPSTFVVTRLHVCLFDLIWQYCILNMKIVGCSDDTFATNFDPTNPRSFGYCPKYSQPPPSPLHKFWATFPLFCKMSYFTKKNGWNDNFEIKNQLRGCLWWWHWSPWTHG